MDYRDFFGIEYPIIQATMTHNGDWPLAAAISNAGGLGVLMTNGGYDDVWLDEQIANLKRATTNPFSVALFQRPHQTERNYLQNSNDVPLWNKETKLYNHKSTHPHYSTDASEDHKLIIDNIVKHIKLTDTMLDVCIDHGVKSVHLLGDRPQVDLVKKCKQNNIRIISKIHGHGHDAFRRQRSYGSEAVILKGYESAGYIGHESIKEMILKAKEIDSNLPIISSGGIFTTEDIQEHLDMGVMAVQLGTRFVCAKESSAHPNYKRAVINSSKDKVQVSHNVFTKTWPRPTRAIVSEETNNYMKNYRDIITQLEKNEITADEAQTALLRLPSTKLKRKYNGNEHLAEAIIEGDIKNGCVMVGASAYKITSEETVEEIMQKLISGLCLT